MQTLYQHPWYSAQQKLESTTECESELTQSQASETTGQKLTNEGEIQWAAGLYEGEGCLYYNKKKDSWCIKIEMTDLDVLEHYASVLGIKVIGPYSHPSRKKEWKDTYYAQTHVRDKIFEIVCDIYPYLGARRRAKCDEFLQWYANKEGMKYD